MKAAVACPIRSATFLHRYRDEPDPATKNPFVDVERGRYFTDAIDWAYREKVTTAISDTLFGTGQPDTRAQAVTFLWRDAGSPKPSAPAGFSDTAVGQYYSNAVAWAADNGVTTGYGDGRFGPNDPVTRAQFAAFMQRYDALTT